MSFCDMSFSKNVKQLTKINDFLIFDMKTVGFCTVFMAYFLKNLKISNFALFVLFHLKIIFYDFL